MGRLDRSCYDCEMSRQSDQQGSGEEKPPPTPFDHPLFLPIILLGLALWFGYDGFVEDDPKMLEHLTFNRVGFALFAAAGLWFGYRGFREWKQTREKREDFGTDQDFDGRRPPPIA